MDIACEIGLDVDIPCEDDISCMSTRGECQDGRQEKREQDVSTRAQRTRVCRKELSMLECPFNSACSTCLLFMAAPFPVSMPRGDPCSAPKSMAGMVMEICRASQ